MASVKSVKVLVCAVLLLTSIWQSMSAPADSDAWSKFKRDFNKSYASPAEEARRRELFSAELERVEAHNAHASASFKLGLNRMSDWTEAEFKQMLGLDRKLSLPAQVAHQSSGPSSFVLDILNSHEPIPKEVDWRADVRRVSPVKRQGSCGSCWSFATTGLLEGQQVARNFTKKLVPLSEQQLLDCIPGDGCEGYRAELALEHVADVGGIMSEEDYGYVANDTGICSLDKSQFVMSTEGVEELPYGDEEVMARVVAHYGPIAVGAAASSWKSYLSGVWPAEVCEGHINHAVLIVGYGEDRFDNKYWIVKNSWGSDLGEDGYIRIERGKNACKIASSPIIAKF